MTYGFLNRLGAGLIKARGALTRGLQGIFADPVNDKTLDRLSDMLLGADFGVSLTQRLVTLLKVRMDHGEISDYNSCKERLKQEIKIILQSNGGSGPNREDAGRKGGTPEGQVGGVQAMAFLGINGVGKTTTIGKLACRFKREGKTVLLAAGDTFRAGAIEQLSIWGKRAGAGLIHASAGADPSAVVFDAIHAAQARHSDYLLIDTAGRLQTHHNLMEALKKITRVISKALVNTPYERILVLDAVTGQNAVSQAKQFHEAIGITGIIVTKLDTAARGGTVVSITEMLRVPVLYAGIGEGIDDLIPFHRDSYLDALFEEP